MGKTGVLTPTAVFEPVEIDGTTVERASVHNISILNELKLCIGDTIEVYKANQIIPQVKRNVSAELRQYTEALEAPTINGVDYCPICHSATKLVTENSSTVLVCTNDNCKGKLLGKLTHFVSKNAMNIEGLSEATLEKFIELGWLTRFEDIYHLDVERDQMIRLDGFGVKSVKNLLNSINKSSNTTLDRFIYALSIPLIGAIPDDENVVIATNQGTPVIGMHAASAKAYLNICKRIMGEEVPFLNLDVKKGFFGKLSKMFKG
jgi:DNA ligase (NAD+)